MLTGKATSAEAESPPELRGSSLVRLESRGERLLKMFGVLSETIGVVSDSIDVPAGLSEAGVLVDSPPCTEVTVRAGEVVTGSVFSSPTIGGGELGA